MTEVAVHLNDKFRAKFERLGEACDIRAAKPFLLLPVKNVDARLLRRELVDNSSSSIGRVIVDE